MSWISQVKSWEGNPSGSGNSLCKGPEAEMGIEEWATGSWMDSNHRVYIYSFVQQACVGVPACVIDTLLSICWGPTDGVKVFSSFSPQLQRKDRFHELVGFFVLGRGTLEHPSGFLVWHERSSVGLKIMRQRSTRAIRDFSMTTSMSPERLGTLTTAHSWCVWQSSAWNLSLSKPWLPRSRKGPLLPASKDCCEVWDNYLWTCPLSPYLSACLIKTLMHEMQVTCNFLFIDLANAYFNNNYNNTGNSLMVQQLGHGAFTAEGLCSTPGQGTKISQITCHGQIIIKMLLMRK